jgi:uncharacterized protein YraI
MRHLLFIAAFLGLLMLPGAAHASNGVSLKAIDLRAGPSGDYPKIYHVRSNVGINVLGCLSNRRWCEVTVGGAHGWTQGSTLGVYDGRGHRHSILGGGDWAYFGLPFITFNERDYWGRYYSDRDFYIVKYGRRHDHDDWDHHRHCNDPDHDHDCHVIIRHDDHDHDRDHDRDHDNGRWHHEDNDNDNDRDDNHWHHYNQ